MGVFEFDPRNGDSVFRNLVPREDLGHAFRRPEESEPIDLGAGSDAVKDASRAGFEQVCAQSATVSNWGRQPLTKAAQKARVSLAMGSGITDAMSGYECRSAWARENALKTLALGARRVK